VTEGSQIDGRRAHQVDENGYCADCDVNIHTGARRWITAEDLQRAEYEREDREAWLNRPVTVLSAEPRFYPGTYQRYVQYPRVEFRELNVETEIDTRWQESLYVWQNDLTSTPNCEINDLPAPPDDYTDVVRTRAWARAVNARGALDEVLASERREAEFRANRAESALYDWEEDQGNEMIKRERRSAKLPEKPVSFSWLDGPAKK
jgi:hypothetical protein